MSASTAAVRPSGASGHASLRAAGAAFALFLAVRGQALLDLPDPESPPFDGQLLLVLAAALWLASVVGTAVGPTADRWALRPGPARDGRRRQALLTGIGLVLATTVVAPLVMGPTGGGLAVLRYPPGAGDTTNSLTGAGALLWLAGAALAAWALADHGGLRAAVRRVWDGHVLHVRVGRTGIAVVAITCLGAIFRLSMLETVPLEMTSDHVEKLIDVSRMATERLWPVYLPGNGGREALEFHWIALLVGLGLPLSFVTLKLGMAIVSILTIPAVYVLGRQVGGREVGLFAALVLALAPWHVIITRLGLRIAFAPLFTALALVFLLRALESGARNDWLAVGLLLGVGMYGYSGFRPMVLVVPVVTLLKVAHDGWRGRASQAVRPALVGHVASAAGLSLLVAAPLIRYAIDRPDAFWGRTLTRVTGTEVPLQAPPAQQLVANMWQALQMFNVTSDSAWFQSPPGRPALETVGGALLVLGVVTAIYRAVHGDWRAAALAATVPIMLLASAMALAFPNEVPHLSRAAGALPAVAVLAALPLPVLVERWRRSLGPLGTAVAFGLVVFAFVSMGRGAWARYFDEYGPNYDHSTENTSEGAAVVRAFEAMGVDLDHVYLVGWSYGWDSRALAWNVGAPDWEPLGWSGPRLDLDAVAAAESHPEDPAPKLYLVGGPAAAASLEALGDLYPDAIVSRHHSRQPEKDFWSLYVPGREEGTGG